MGMHGVGDALQALGLLNEMEKRGVPPDIVSYNTALDALAKCGEYEQALQFFQEIENKGTCLCLRVVLRHRDAFPFTGVTGFKPNLVSYNTAINACGKVLTCVIVQFPAAVGCTTLSIMLFW